jgi:4-hydroxy-3-polyprenylbenzoate decarboxylase
MRIIVAVTGASGSLYAKRLLEELRTRNVEIHLILSETGSLVAKEELGGVEELKALADEVYDPQDLRAPPTSGSFKVDGMIIVPASMKTVAAIAHGYSGNLITRAADVQLKEGRTLILVPRETPLSPIHLRNLLRLSLLGVKIIPASPAFYHKPKRINDLIDFIVGKILEQLGFEHNLYEPWNP